MTVTTAHPLSWPNGWKRTPANSRQRAKFSRQQTGHSNRLDGTTYRWNRQRELTVADAIDRVLSELRTFGVSRDDIIISTNIQLRNDGLPRSGQREPDDPGAAVYWRRNANESQRCMAIDQYTRLADNLAAIAATLNAMRSIERHGGAEILDRAFEGFAALPPAGGSSAVSWWTVLGVNQMEKPEIIKAAYRYWAKLHHPDNGGDAEKFIVVQKAYEEAQRELDFS